MNKRQVSGWKKHWDFILLDIAVLQLSYILAYWLARGIHNPFTVSIFRYLDLVLLVSQIAVILFSDNYSGILRRNRYRELAAVAKFTAVMLALVTVYLFARKDSSTVSRLQTGMTVVVYLALDWVLRVLLKRHVRRKIIRERGQKSLVVVTSARIAEEVLQKLFRHNSYCDFHVARMILLDAELPEGYPAEMPAGDVALGEQEYMVPVSLLDEQAVRELTHGWVDEVFVFQPADMLFPMDLMDTLMTMGITVNYSAEAIDRMANTDLRKLGDFSVLTVGHRFANAGALAFKRLFDIFGGLVGCVLTGVIFLFVAPFIYRADPGPVFFTQERIGQNGKRIKIHKFRSMVLDAEARKAELQGRNKMQGLMFKVDDDPRILPGIGSFIRRTSLDEFPQFYDCLIGNLSLVGWRPATVDEWERYTPEHRIRASMKPGITGMWQVSGRSTITDFDEIVRLDREYIENWSLLLDLKILLKTVVVVLSRRGAE